MAAVTPAAGERLVCGAVYWTRAGTSRPSAWTAGSKDNPTT